MKFVLVGDGRQEPLNILLRGAILGHEKTSVRHQVGFFDAVTKRREGEVIVYELREAPPPPLDVVVPSLEESMRDQYPDLIAVFYTIGEGGVITYWTSVPDGKKPSDKLIRIVETLPKQFPTR